MELAILILMGCCIFIILYPGLVIKFLSKLKGGKIKW